MNVERVLTKFKDQIKINQSIQHKSIVSLKNIISENFKILEPILIEKNIHVQYKHEKDLFIIGEKDQLKEAIYNILSNSVEAMPNGGYITL